MDFFGRQDQARQRTRWLIVVFVLAVALIAVAVSVVLALLLQALNGQFTLPERAWFGHSAGLLTAIAAATVAFILLASLFRHLRLRAGGGEVAAALGGEPVLPEDRDPGRRRLQNTIEEMAVAAGIPTPQAYVLEHEGAINAFAAGHSPADAAVAVTRGALDRLSRDELQGVVGHEFSHILNGDMRLNIRLMGYLFGILALSTLGRVMLRSGGHRGIRLGRSGRGGVVALAGVAIYLLGYAGVLAGRLIQAAVSRQREFLADASAVQFTRQTEGLAGALRKIAGIPAHSWLAATRAEEVSHMLFASGRRGFASLFATHPPVAARLRALGAPVDEPPTAAGAGGSAVSPGAAGYAAGYAAEHAAGFAGGLPEPLTGGVAAAGVSGLAGVSDAASRRFARSLQARVPAETWAAIHRSDLAVPCLLALLLDPDPAVRTRQVAIIGGRMGAAVAGHAGIQANLLAGVTAAERLALADVAFPPIRRLPRIRRDYLRETIEQLIAVDGELDVYEALLAGRVTGYLKVLGHPPRARRIAVHDQTAAAVRLLAALAIKAHRDRGEAEAAFAAGLAGLAGTWPVDRATPLPTRVPPLADLKGALATLAGLEPEAARRLVDALAAAAAADGRISELEFALLRAVCGALDVPLPPVVAAPGGDARQT